MTTLAIGLMLSSLGNLALFILVIMQRRRTDVFFHRERQLSEELAKAKLNSKWDAKCLAKLQGELTKATIDSKVSTKMASKAFDLANESIVRVGALEKSTHRVQFISAEKLLERNTKLDKQAQKIFNPGNEQFDWFDDGILGTDLDELQEEKND